MSTHKEERNESQIVWRQNKYYVLSKSQKLYLDIRQAMKSQKVELAFIQSKIDEAKKLPENRKESVNAFQHIWGYFKKQASKLEREKFFRLLEDYQAFKIEQSQVITYIQELIKQYPNQYLVESTLLMEDKAEDSQI